jgi:hypothetical protein
MRIIVGVFLTDLDILKYVLSDSRNGNSQVPALL